MRPCLAIGVFVSFAAGAQQSLLQVSPGPVAEVHAKWDDGGPGCLQCHALSGAVEASLCLGCHAHQRLKEALERKEGLHSSFRRPCLECHTDHQGRAGAIADWREVGGQSGFNHTQTGFALAGMHEKVKCSACHKRRTPTSPISFVGLSQKCDSCHQNRHRFTNQALREQCLDCHPKGGVAPKKMTPEHVPFDHGEVTGVALAGKHAKVQCVKCHLNAKMSMEKVRTCAKCHQSKHGKVYLKLACKECHDQSRPWKETSFDHAARTEFSLEARHRQLPCSRCHKRVSVKPKADCGTCHGPTHGPRFAGLKCLDCHARGGDGSMVFSHAKRTKFPLAAKHAQVGCRGCHRGKKPTRFERISSIECASCHAHQKAHHGEFQDKPCSECHASGSKKLLFDHDKDARFPLLGLHARLATGGKCRTCHKGGGFRSGKTQCADCHQDPHQAQLGPGCERCHSPEVKFAEIRFEHRLAKFPLEGLHRQVRCAECHPRRAYLTGKTRCADCHREDDPHRGKLGEACEKCHLPEKGAPRFSHETMTSFARTGRHRSTDCVGCHRTGSPPGSLDQQFGVKGKSCSQCHPDPHQGRNGEACDGCHGTDSFQNVSLSIHDTGPWRLAGVHQQLECKRCHGGGRLLAGTGETCQLCHLDDDAHRNALGPSCGDCHGQSDWLPARFSHAQTGFPLRGAHRTARCPRCHGVGTFQGLPADCESCHREDAARVADPPHTVELRPCERCHQESGFVPARGSHPAFELRGQHLSVRCVDCHRRGYAGTPAACESCHLARYLDPSTQPDHRQSGYGISCEDCHAPLGWRPAKP